MMTCYHVTNTRDWDFLLDVHVPYITFLSQKMTLTMVPQLENYVKVHNDCNGDDVDYDVGDDNDGDHCGDDVAPQGKH